MVRPSSAAGRALCYGVTQRNSAGVDMSQVILVHSSGTAATVQACEHGPHGWEQVLGTYYGHVGYSGVVDAAAKREGDGATPAGMYRLLGGFGVDADPGLRLGWEPVETQDVWVDDPASRFYNRRETGPARGRWSHSESLDQPGPYGIAQIIDYNPSRTPGRGSAIFLHLDQGAATAGCVSLSRAALEAVMRWERPGVVIDIH